MKKLFLVLALFGQIICSSNNLNADVFDDILIFKPDLLSKEDKIKFDKYIEKMKIKPDPKGYKIEHDEKIILSKNRLNKSGQTILKASELDEIFGIGYSAKMKQEIIKIVQEVMQECNKGKKGWFNFKWIPIFK